MDKLSLVVALVALALGAYAAFGSSDTPAGTEGAASTVFSL